MVSGALSTVLVEEDMVRGSRGWEGEGISRWQGHSVVGALSPEIDHTRAEFLRECLRATVVQARKPLLKVAGF